MKNKILIVSGDPNSINSEIIFKTFKKLNKSIRARTYLISNFNLLKKQFKLLGYTPRMIKVKNFNDKVNKNLIKIIDVEIKFSDPFNVHAKAASKFVIDSLAIGHKLALRSDVIGLINCPIDKKLLKLNNLGVTEFLSRKCNLKKNSEVMLIRNDKLSVCPITTHIDIKDIRKKLKKDLILNKIQTIDRYFKKNYKFKPKIGVMGLNPHNSELNKKSEEKKIIIPAIKRLKKENLLINGPLVADTLFVNNYKKYDVIVGMYHDQILTPFKTIFKFDAINITLGLKYIRVSPDHGTAKNIIKRKKGNPDSLIKCFQFLNKIK